MLLLVVDIKKVVILDHQKVDMAADITVYLAMCFLCLLCSYDSSITFELWLIFFFQVRRKF